MNKIKAYQCDYCSYYKITKKLVANHEKICLSNPETRSCATFLFMPEYKDYTCGCGVDVKNGLKTQCDKYICHEDYIQKLDEIAFEAHRDITHDETIEYIESYAESKTN